MKNIDQWQPTKFIKDDRGRFQGTHMHQAIGPVYEAAVRNHAQGDLVDLGCGAVPLYHFYKDQATSITCIDWESSGIQEKTHLDIVHDLNQPLPLPDKMCDTVICTDVLEHIRYPHDLFREMGRIIRPNGKLILTVPYYYRLHEKPYDYYRYTEFSLKGFCEDNGFEVVSLTQYGGAPEILFDIFYKSFTYMGFRLFRIMKGSILSFGKFMLRRRWVQKYSHITRENFPLGYCLVAKKI